MIDTYSNLTVFTIRRCKCTILTDNHITNPSNRSIPCLPIYVRICRNTMVVPTPMNDPIPAPAPAPAPQVITIVINNNDKTGSAPPGA